jgi:hypothetical protein
MAPQLDSTKAPASRRVQSWPRAMMAVAALLMTTLLNAHGSEQSTPVDSEVQAADAARDFVVNAQRVLELQLMPKMKEGIVRLTTTHPSSLGIFITEDPSPYHLAVTADKRGAINVQISLGYLAMHDAALDAVALSSALNRPQELRKYLRYQLAMARKNEVLTKQGSARLRVKTFAQFMNLKQSVIQAIYSQPQWQRDRQVVGADSLGWVLSYLLVRHDRRLSGDSVAIPASASAAKLAGAAGFFPAPPFSTAYQLEEVTNPGQQDPPDRQLLCRAADFLDAGVSLLKSEQAWQLRAADNEALRTRIQKLREDVARMQRDARCAKRDSTEA